MPFSRVVRDLLDSDNVDDVSYVGLELSCGEDDVFVDDGTRIESVGHGYKPSRSPLRQPFVTEEDSLDGGREAGQEVPRTLPGSLDNINNWILPTALAEILAYKPDFRTTLLTLFEEKYLNPDSVSKVVHAYDKTFRLNYETVELRPELVICSDHASGEGCVSISECSDLHLCQDYVDGSCNNDLCLLGHVCTTDHNSRILQNYFVSTLPSEILLMLIRGTSPCPQPLGPLDVCRNYNDFRGCGRRDCDALHICLSFVQGNAKCPYPSCTLIHDLTQPSVQKLLMKHGLPTNEAPIDIVKALVCNNTTLRQPRQVVLLPQVPVPPHTSTTVWSHHLYGDVDIPEICRVSVVGMCPNEGIGCPRLHSTEYTQWQVSEQGNSWMNLRARQSQRLEQVFCDPAQRSVCLPPLYPDTLEPWAEALLPVMGQHVLSSDFDKMLLVSIEKNLQLRRLCVEAGEDPAPARTFLWYYEQRPDEWVQLEHQGAGDLINNFNSTYIEKKYIESTSQSITLNNVGDKYCLNFSTMTLTHNDTQRIHHVRRRPKPHLKENSTVDPTVVNLPNHWEPITEGVFYRLITLATFSEEYTTLRELLLNSISHLTISKVERIQNPFLWRAFQNKIHALTTLNNDRREVNVRHLFHGTRHDVLKLICADNLDWRLHGSNSGHKYGRGSYFTPDATKALSYCHRDPEGKRYLLVAQVAVGTTVEGNSSMTRPPLNPITGRLFDSTVDDSITPTVIVKYDKQEYYPEYMVTLE